MLGLLEHQCFHSVEHKAFDKAFGPPQILIAQCMFNAILVGYTFLTKTFSNPLIGLLLPVGCSLTEIIALHLLENALINIISGASIGV